ncbi:hypothetical protein Nepgr_028865 [Nepenthes gracilis]|uniref:RRM domain-containing protein n=1 Tax=Nepenthes gracilis TaxID=150966 RepID=A0AAD3TCV1_NEPGR|nr:hypothetical protein Nepgr_028865 [Nepenthes gracilis]
MLRYSDMCFYFDSFIVQMSNFVESRSTDHQHDVKGAEVFVGGLAQSVTENNISEVFASCGKIMEIRMIKDQQGNSKGYCFVRFSTRDAAGKAVKDKNGLMLEGRKIGVLPSTDQKSLFLGNLHKDWSTDDFNKIIRQVFQDVVSADLAMPPIGIDGASGQKRRNQGFGFVTFSSHAAAARAYRMGTKTDFVIGGKWHPTVEWAEEEPEIDPEELSKVKVAFVRDLPFDVDEAYLKKLFEPYGKLEKIVLSKKSNSQVGFVHFAERSDLENAINQMNDKSVQGTDGGLSFRLQVEVARPFDKNRKRTRDQSSRPASGTTSQSKVLKGQLAFSSSADRVSKPVEEPVVIDPYEATVISLPGPVKDRLLRILRLGIASRYDIGIKCLTNLKELPESTAISVLDQFMLSGGDAIDKGAFLAGLISNVYDLHGVKSLEMDRFPLYTSRYTSRARDLSLGSDLPRLSGRRLMTVESSSHVGTAPLRSDSYVSRLSSLDYPSSPQVGIPKVEKTSPPTFHQPLVPSPGYGRAGMDSPLGAATTHQSTRQQVRFDPFTGEPYKFDPFTVFDSSTLALIQRPPLSLSLGISYRWPWTLVIQT